MKHLLCAMVVAFTFTCAGCDSVSLSEPFGDPVDANERAKLVGTWQFGDAAGHLLVKQTKQGELIAGLMQWDEANGGYRVDNLELVATQFGEHQFIHLRNRKEPEKQRGWSFARYEGGDEEELLTYIPLAKRFEQAVDNGQLQGNVSKENRHLRVQVTSARAEVEAFLKAGTIADYFSKEPLKLNLRKL
jgi:hypothetical protein